ncbi:hypothetical protein CCR75_006373 [Bremia lactucae]|uniref:FACT complex subunit n=1 Tax=Bremia lactucae TaxID=4779 RepID=A0A976FP88_BRELC|nr:hypothetical protein CCR75_006379 [Bremia lactucae]TDH70076.1 hypothetical protein CCR75_006373 [Bremia lactucae]
MAVRVKQEVKSEVPTDASALSTPHLDASMFYRRLDRLYSVWKEHKHEATWNQVDSFSVLSGRAQQEESGYRKSAVLQIFLLGFLEFPETLLVFTPATLFVLTSGKKYTMLEAVAHENAMSSIQLRLLKRNKVDHNKANFKLLLEAMEASGPKTGVLRKENPVGELVTTFQSALNHSTLEQVDVTRGLETVLMIKEPQELENIRWAGALSSKVFKLKFMEDMEQIIDDEQIRSHEDISMAIEEVFDTPSKIKVTIDPVDIEPCYPPIVQSGGTYDLRPSAQSNQDPLTYDVIICSLGARYKGYCSNVGRTFFIDPTSSMEKAYELLREAHENVSKSEEDKATYLRVNFFVPGTSLGRDVLPAMANAILKYPNKMFIKELGFRSSDAHNLNNQFRLIKELQKRVKQREQREQEESDLVVQEDLIITRDRRVPRLIDLSARPHLTGRKTHGTLEAHSNGVRFTTNKNQKLDILYANVKHAIFQPCDKELVVLIHFHLKNHIMIGKKKQKDVQFYTEVIEGSQTLDNRRRSIYDPDELDEENRERALREKLNTTFKEFCHKMETVSERHGKPVVFDIPYRELGFMGTPFKEMVLLQPSVHCLVSLTDMPFFIISLDEVEHVHFERVMFSSKNFDVVFVFKNFDVMPIRISAVSMSELERIKEWLDDIDICFTTGTANLNWKSIMSTIKSDNRFYLDTDEDGVPKPAGWEFLKLARNNKSPPLESGFAAE